MYKIILKELLTIFPSGKQFGFRKDNSPENAVHKLINNIYESLDNNIIIFCIFPDLSKASDNMCYR